MSALNEMDALVFSSRVDNYPLILCEALSIGVPVLATHSEAAQEVLAKSGGQTFAATDVLRLAQRRKPGLLRRYLAPRWTPFVCVAASRTAVNRCWRSMSRSIRICSYLLLPADLPTGQCQDCPTGKLSHYHRHFFTAVAAVICGTH